MDYKYNAADFYIVCILKPSVNQNIDVQDTQEVSAAKWIPLSEITTNEDGTKFKLFATPFEFVKLIKQQLFKTGKIPDDQAQEGPKEISPDVANMSVTDVIKSQTLSHRSQDGYDSRAKKERIWNFYMPHSLDAPLQ